MVQTKKNQQGFALLISLLMLAVVISVTLSIVELTRNQLRLAIDGRDAEVAFQAASAGVECAQRIARTASSTIQDGLDDVDFECFERSVFSSNSSNSSNLNGTGLGGLRRYQVSIPWEAGNGTQRCTDIDLIVIANEVESDTATITNIDSIIANYPAESLACPPGGTCHVVATAGYNVNCDRKGDMGVLKRELLLEF